MNTRPNHPGFFITLEGTEACGKTSQIPYIVENLRIRGFNVFATREPGGTAISEQIRGVIHSLENVEMHPRTETLLYQAARAQIVEQVIKPRLLDGQIVISDRFFDSTIAYQGYGHRQDLSDIKSLVQFATGGLRPDLTLLLDLDPEIGRERKYKGTTEWNRMDALSMDFYYRAREGYLEMAKEDPVRWVVVDASLGIDELGIAIRSEIVNKLSFYGMIEGSRGGLER